MLYSLVCILKGKYSEYHKMLIDDVAERFNLEMVKNQNLPSHFIIKYPFISKNSTKVERIISNFMEDFKPIDINIGGINGFPPDTIFNNVELLGDGISKYARLMEELKKIDIFPWNKYDYPNLKLHSTIAQMCDKEYFQIIAYLKKKEKFFKTKFDNITILKCPDGGQYTDSWKIHKEFRKS